MKAKEYVARYNATKDKNQALSELVQGLLTEVNEIGKARHANSNASLRAILKEQQRKWEAITRLILGLAHDGFKELVRAEMPDIYRATWHSDSPIN